MEKRCIFDIICCITFITEKVPLKQAELFENRIIIYYSICEHIVSENTFQFWFQRFRSGNFDVNDKPRCEQFHDMKDENLKDLLAKNATQSSDLADETVCRYNYTTRNSEKST